MAEKSKSREITITDEGGTFNAFLKRFTGGKDYDFGGISLLSNEKARLMHIIKTKNPKSIYELAKLTGRDFKSVSGDVKILEKFGFVDMMSERTGKRERLRPVLVVDTMNIKIRI
jgi:DNA-binding MarR family transcriptional regulator